MYVQWMICKYYKRYRAVRRYLNGDAVTPALPVVLRPLDFASMRIVLTRITERLHVDERLARQLRR